uniref:Uncharacterized protein n=1 Tax=Romanomermis culicivorax TaxID=13658 RepID=A0A915HLW9_ROMCU
MQNQVTTSAAQKLKIDYEEKLIKMRSELNRLKSVTKEHERLIKQQRENNRRLNRLQEDVSEMKNIKVSLMKKIKEDARKTRDIELKRAKEAAQYQKDVRRRDIELRTLKIEKEKREAILKRKQDEIRALRHVQTFSASSKRRLGTAVNDSEATSKMKNYNNNIFSPKTAKQRLSLIEK